MKAGKSWAALGCALCMNAGAQTSDVWLVFGGTQASSPSGYSYLGVLKPLHGASLGQGAFHRTIASWLRYEYETTVAGQRVMAQARAPGVETGWGYAWRTGGTQMEASLSVGVRDTDLRPAALDSDVRGVQWALTPQWAMQHPLSATCALDVMASYALGPRDRYLRARVLESSWMPGGRVGLELSHQQGQTYRQVSWGLVGSRDVAGGVRLELGAGQMLSREGRTDPYLSLAFSWVPR
ncbi:MAG: cellulose biosynthesis protein BcsS [Aquabacterium sp.]